MRGNHSRGIWDGGGSSIPCEDTILWSHSHTYLSARRYRETRTERHRWTPIRYGVYSVKTRKRARNQDLKLSTSVRYFGRWVAAQTAALIILIEAANKENRLLDDKHSNIEGP
jgi:hypothetical protein